MMDDLALSSWLVVAGIVITLARWRGSLSRPRPAARPLGVRCIAAVGEVGYVCLVGRGIGDLCLVAMFALLPAGRGGTLDLDAWRPAVAGPLRDAIFITALVGLGIKAGMMPLHVWLPGAHANAPS